VDLWYVLLDSITASGLEAEYRAFLGAEEVTACDRFAFAEGRRQCLVSRVLVRTVLSWYTGDAPAVWEFRSNDYGKPAVVRPAGCPLQFNLSHTTGLVVCAVSLAGDVGIDAEDLTRRAADPSLASNYFAPEEVALLESVPEEERQLRFLQLWTLKEAFIKAKGRGLSIPLKDFAFSFPSGRPPRVAFHDPALGDANQWHFAQLRLRRRFQLAVALHLPGEANVVLRVRQTVPLRSIACSQTLTLAELPEWALDGELVAERPHERSRGS
jgi:4'-phosphopantetheinyl transferase